MQNTTVIIAIVICFCVSLTATVLRFWVRRADRSSFTASEYAILAAQTFLMLLLIIQTLTLVELETWKHPPEYIGKLFFTSGGLYFLVLWSVKVSIGLLYLRISSNSWVSVVARLALIVIGVSGAIITILYLYPSSPIQKGFALHRGATGCAVTSNCFAFWSGAVLNLASDLILFFIPMPLLLNITNHQLQAALFLIFVLALLVMSTSIASNSLIATGHANPRMLILLSQIECATAVTISALPGLSRPLTSRVRKSGNAAISSTLPNSAMELEDANAF